MDVVQQTRVSNLNQTYEPDFNRQQGHLKLGNKNVLYTKFEIDYFIT